MIRPKTYLVFPNPWGVAPNSITIDASGRPAGHLPTDPNEDGSLRKWVGVRLDTTRTKLLGDPKDYRDGLRSQPQTTVYTFLGISGDEVTAKILAKQQPVKIPATRYYRAAIASGQLIAADETTALAAGLKKFTEPAKALAQREKEAIAAFNAMHGEGTFAAHAKNRKADEPSSPSPKPKTGSRKD